MPSETLVNSDLVRLRESGLTIAQISKETGLSFKSVYRSVSKIKFRRKCLLPECLAEFETTRSNSVYCCREHSKLGLTRKSIGSNPVVKECFLPECQNKVLSFEGARRFCSVSCAKRDLRRERDGFYGRLLGEGHECLVCGERIVLDEHHTNLTHGQLAYRNSAVPNKSDKDGPSVYLCPNHHMMVHRGLAKMENGKFVSLVQSIKEAYLKKRGLVVELDLQ